MLNVWLVTADSTTLLGEAERGVFWSGACYMCLYSYTHGGVERTLLYFWKGRDVSALNFLTWRFQLQQLLDEAVAAGTIPIMCSQDEEPDRFIALMEGMVVSLAATRAAWTGGSAAPTAATATATATTSRTAGCR